MRRELHRGCVTPPASRIGIVTLKKVLRFSAIYLVFSAFAAGALLVDSWPMHPLSGRQWVLLLAVALPVTLTGERLGEGCLP